MDNLAQRYVELYQRLVMSELAQAGLAKTARSRHGLAAAVCPHSACQPQSATNAPRRRRTPYRSNGGNTTRRGLLQQAPPVVLCADADLASECRLRRR